MQSDKSQYISLNENELVDTLCLQLIKKFDWIKKRNNPATSKIVKKYLKEKLNYIPLLQPDIDIIFLEKSGNLNAVEVKLFRPKSTGFKMRFYKGIDQALALHRYGFNYVALWQFFHPSINMDDINKYGAESWYFIRNRLKLPLDFSYFKIILEDDEYKFHILQYESPSTGFSLGKAIDDSDFRIDWKYENPYKNDRTSVEIRESIIKYLKIPIKTIYNPKRDSFNVIAHSNVVTVPINNK